MTAQTPPAIDIDQLRELAKAAEDTWEDIEPYWYTGLRALPVDDEDRKFIAATNPSVILALLQELEEFRAMKKQFAELEIDLDLARAEVSRLNDAIDIADFELEEKGR